MANKALSFFVAVALTTAMFVGGVMSTIQGKYYNRSQSAIVIFGIKTGNCQIPGVHSPIKAHVVSSDDVTRGQGVNGEQNRF